MLPFRVARRKLDAAGRDGAHGRSGMGLPQDRLDGSDFREQRKAPGAQIFSADFPPWETRAVEQEDGPAERAQARRERTARGPGADDDRIPDVSHGVDLKQRRQLHTA